MKKLLRKIGTRNRGFTLIELLIVMAIIAILVAIVAMSLTGFLSGARQTVWQADQRSLQSAVMAYYAEHGEWPTSTGLAGDLFTGNWVDGVYSGTDPLVPDYILEVPASDDAANWQVGAVTPGVVTGTPLATPTPPSE